MAGSGCASMRLHTWSKSTPAACPVIKSSKRKNKSKHHPKCLPVLCLFFFLLRVKTMLLARAVSRKRCGFCCYLQQYGKLRSRLACTLGVRYSGTRSAGSRPLPLCSKLPCRCRC